MDPLPFSLRVPGVDAFTLKAIGSTRFDFRGLLQLTREDFSLEWTGSAHVDEVALTGIRSERLALPLESVRLPYSALRTVQLRGGWFRPRFELTAARLDALRMVPSEEAGRLQLWLSRRDRPLARRILAGFMCYQRALGDGPPSPVAAAIATTTPPAGAV